MRQGPADGEIRAGQIVLCDVDRPYTFAHRADFTSVAFIMPQDAVTAGARTAGEPRVFAMTPREARGGEPSREPAGHTPGRR